MEKPQFRKHQNDDVRIIDLRCKDLRDIMAEFFTEKFNEFAHTLTPIRPNTGDLLTRKQTADRFNITLPTLREWTKSGKLKSYKVKGSRRVYYRSNQIDSALGEQPGNVRK